MTNNIENNDYWLMNGDCLEELKKLKDKSVDMILCDPPYGTTACKWDVVIPFDEMWKELNRIIKDKGCIALFGSEPFSSHLRMSNIKNFKYDWIWDKVTARGHLVAKKRPMQQTEIISIFNSGCYYPIMIPRDQNKIKRSKEYRRTEIMGGDAPISEYKIYDTWYPKNIFTFSNAGGIKVHPTQKPIPLLEYLIKTYTLEGETVLDFTMGSGSTGVACKNLNRKFIGIEKDEKYFEIAKNRIV